MYVHHEGTVVQGGQKKASEPQELNSHIVVRVQRLELKSSARAASASHCGIISILFLFSKSTLVSVFHVPHLVLVMGKSNV